MPMATIRHLPILRILVLVVVLLLVLGSGGSAVVAAPADRLELVRLAAVPTTPESPSGSIRFQVQLNYALGSTPSGFLVLFVFEDDAQRSSQYTSNAVPIQAGAGRATLEIEYVPAPRVKMLTLFAGLFTQERRLLGWVVTNPMPLASWTGRVQFEEAMAARLAGNHAAAIEHLSRAIEASPDTGNLYYWRADTLVRLGRYDEAIEDYTKALELMPEHRASMLGRGVARLWKEQWESSWSDLTAVLDSGGDLDTLDAWAHRARGVAHAATGRPGEAIADYEAYLSMVPEASDRAEVEGWISQLRPLVESS